MVGSTLKVGRVWWPAPVTPAQERGSQEVILSQPVCVCEQGRAVSWVLMPISCSAVATACCPRGLPGSQARCPRCPRDVLGGCEHAVLSVPASALKDCVPGQDAEPFWGCLRAGCGHQDSLWPQLQPEVAHSCPRPCRCSGPRGGNMRVVGSILRTKHVWARVHVSCTKE